MHRILLLAVVMISACSAPPAKSPGGGSNNGVSNNGAANNGANNGASNNGAVNNGASNNGASNNGASNNGASNNGAANNGGTSGTLLASSYERSCTYDQDCVLVHEGDDVCECRGACPNTAIASSATDAWNDGWEAACPDGDEGLCSRAPCHALIAACGSGQTCSAIEPVFVDATDWDTSCAADDDCVVVYEGDVCSNCVCGGTAVNRDEYSKYQDAVDSADCNPGPSDCDCATETEAWCSEGACQLGQNPMCAGMDGDGFFGSCMACGDNCDTISTTSGTRSACGCDSSADCPCGLRCGSYEIAPNVVVNGVCVR